MLFLLMLKISRWICFFSKLLFNMAGYRIFFRHTKAKHTKKCVGQLVICNGCSVSVYYIVIYRAEFRVNSGKGQKKCPN